MGCAEAERPPGSLSKCDAGHRVDSELTMSPYFWFFCPTNLDSLKSCGKKLVKPVLSSPSLRESESEVKFPEKKIRAMSAKFDVFACPRLYSNLNNFVVEFSLNSTTERVILVFSSFPRLPIVEKRS